MRFEFRGKSGKAHAVGAARPPRWPASCRRCQDLPGQELFQYLDDDGERAATIDSADVNAYLREIAGEDFTAKDFRTWAGTVLAALALARVAGVRTPARGQAQRRAGDRARGRGGSATRRPSAASATSTPQVLDAYLDGVTIDALKKRTEREIGEGLDGLDAREGVVLGLLQQRLARQAETARAA